MSCRTSCGKSMGLVSAASFAAAQLVRAIPRVRLSRMVGRLCDQPLPRPLARVVERVFVTAYGIDVTEAAPRVGAYPSFDALFTRELRPGARKIDAAPVVSPADGVLRAAGPIGSGVLTVKARQYSVAELLGSASTGDRYATGSFALIYLSPADYHRVHSPVDGRITSVRSLPGDLFPVNSLGEKIPRLYVRNQRVAIHVETEHEGLVTVVMVGAVLVGRITVRAVPGTRVPVGLHKLEKPIEVRKGDELGTFHLGSSVVVLFEAEQALVPPGERFRYGQSLLRAS